MPAISKTMAFDSVPEESTEVPDTLPELPAEDTGETLSLDVFGGSEPAVGDRVTLEVISIDPDSGSVTVRMPAGGEKTGGIADAAAALDEEPI